MRTITDLMKAITRKKVAVSFNDLTSVKPASPLFGLDRGTPIDRYYVEKFLSGHRELIRGRVLEIGAIDYAKRFSGNAVKTIEVLSPSRENRQATITGDLTDQSTLPEGTIDCFICTQTFNFIYDVKAAVEGAAHLLKPGGVLLATVAGISQISRYDMERWGDYWRFTTASIRALFEPEFGRTMEIRSFGNVMATIAFLQGITVEDLPDAALLDESDEDYQLLITIMARKAA